MALIKRYAFQINKTIKIYYTTRQFNNLFIIPCRSKLRPILKHAIPYISQFVLDIHLCRVLPAISPDPSPSPILYPVRTQPDLIQGPVNKPFEQLPFNSEDTNPEQLLNDRKIGSSGLNLNVIFFFHILVKCHFIGLFRYTDPTQIN